MRNYARCIWMMLTRFLRSSHTWLALNGLKCLLGLSQRPKYESMPSWLKNAGSPPHARTRCFEDVYPSP
jgi:hypothetical protein